MTSEDGRNAGTWDTPTLASKDFSEFGQQVRRQYPNKEKKLAPKREPYDFLWWS